MVVLFCQAVHEMLNRLRQMRSGKTFAYTSVDQFMQERTRIIDLAMTHGNAIKVIGPGNKGNRSSNAEQLDTDKHFFKEKYLQWLFL